MPVTLVPSLRATVLFSAMWSVTLVKVQSLESAM
jgi:hypothetical protein